MHEPTLATHSASFVRRYTLCHRRDRFCYTIQREMRTELPRTNPNPAFPATLCPLPSFRPFRLSYRRQRRLSIIFGKRDSCRNSAAAAQIGSRDRRSRRSVVSVISSSAPRRLGFLCSFLVLEPDQTRSNQMKPHRG